MVIMALPDVQNIKGDYKFPVMAGVSGLYIPIKVARISGELVDTVATADLRTNLAKDLRGINMSRLPIILGERLQNDWVVEHLRELLRDINKIVESDYSTVKLQFPFFFIQAAPVTGLVGTSHCEVTLEAKLRGYPDHSAENYQSMLTVKAFVTTLCPCSKEISAYSAHNQRATVEMVIGLNDFDIVYIEELVAIAESCSSCCRYPVLKRPDEKYVTEKAYENPKFVEDLAREVASRLDENRRIDAFRVTAISEESIHQHDAVAVVEKGM